MAFADLGSLGATGSTSNNQGSLALTTTAAVAVGDLVVVVVANDNLASGGDDLATASITNSGTANTWTKAIQVANAVAAQGGASCSVWYTVATSAIASGGTITANFTNANNSDSTALTARKFSLASGNTVALEGTPATQVNNTGADPASLNLTTANIACLRIRALAVQVGNNTNLTPTSTWTAWANGNSATTGTVGEMCARAEHLISTGTGAASDPTYVSAIYASAYVAFKETLAPITGTLNVSTDGADTAASGFAGNVITNGQLTVTEPLDTLAVTGTVSAGVVTPAAPTLDWTSLATDAFPDFNATGDFQIYDLVRYQWSPDPTFATGVSESTNTIDAAEDAALTLDFEAPAALAYSTWYFRCRIERPDGSGGWLIGAWSGTETVALTAPAVSTGTLAVIDKPDTVATWYGGINPAQPVLDLLTDYSDTTPEFNATGDFQVGDIVHFQWSTSLFFVTAVNDTTNTIDAAESAAQELNFLTGALAEATWYFRFRIERPTGGGYIESPWSNTESVTLGTSGIILAQFDIIEPRDTAALLGQGGIVGTLAVTDKPDTAALLATSEHRATLAVSDKPDFPVFTGNVQWSAALAVTDKPDTAAFTANSEWMVTLAVSEPRDTATSTTGSVAWNATLAVTDQPDTANFSSLSGITGTLGVNDPPDTAQMNATVAWYVTLAVTDKPDTAAFIAFAAAYGPLGVSDQPDTLLFNATAAWSATLAVSDKPDTASFTGGIVASGTLNVTTDKPDTAAFTGGTAASGTLAVTEPADTAQFFVNIVGAGLNANMDARETADTAAFTAQVTGVAGTLAALETADTAAMTATVLWTATLAATDKLDTAAFTVATGWSATLAVSETADTAFFTGLPGVFGTLAVSTDKPDTAALTGGLLGGAILAVTEPRDTFEGAATPINGAILAATDKPDIAFLTSSAGIMAQLGVADKPDTGTGTADTRWDAVMFAVGQPDTASFTGTAEWLGVLAATETKRDTASASGSIVAYATLAATEPWPDTFKGHVLALDILFTQFHVTDKPDRAKFTGEVTGYVGYLDATEGADTALFRSGYVHKIYSVDAKRNAPLEFMAEAS